MAETEIGWTKEFPRVESAEGAVYWWRRNRPHGQLPVIGIAHIFEDDPLDGFDRESVEWLGPISPSDFEELTRLRAAAAYSADVLDLAEAAMTAAAPYCARDLEIAIRERIVKVKNAITALREALAQHPIGEKL